MINKKMLMTLGFIVLSACSGLPEARVPLSAPGSEPYDPRILGSWIAGEKNGDEFFIHFRKRSAPNILDAVGHFVEFKKGDFTAKKSANVEWMTAVIHPSKLDGSTYYNIKRFIGIGNDYGADDSRKGYIIAKMNLTDDRTLNLCLMNPSTIKNAIKAGKIKGSLVEENSDKKIALEYYFMDVTKDELIALMRDNTAGKLFEACVDFKKLS